TPRAVIAERDVRKLDCNIERADRTGIGGLVSGLRHGMGSDESGMAIVACRLSRHNDPWSVSLEGVARARSRLLRRLRRVRAEDIGAVAVELVVVKACQRQRISRHSSHV